MKLSFFLLVCPLMFLNFSYLYAATDVFEGDGAFGGEGEAIELDSKGLRLMNRIIKEEAPEAPSARRWHLMWEGDSGVYLFGGKMEKKDSSETFKFSGGSWTQLFPSTSPPAMYGLKGEKGIFFGGYRDGEPVDYTWGWDKENDNWFRIYTDTAPAARFGHSFALTDNQGVLFGGYIDSSIAYSSDTWVFDVEHKKWEEKKPPSSPPARKKASMTGMGGGKVLMFGGEGKDEDGSYLGDTWIYSVSDSSWTKIEGEVSPPARRRAAMTYNSDENVAVLFGGKDSSAELLNDIWVFNPETALWQEQFPRAPDGKPAERQSFDFVYCSALKLSILFGGDYGDKDDFLGDTWSYGLSSNGIYTSQEYDAGAADTELKILALDFSAEVPLDAEVRFRLAASTSPGAEVFRGPDGSKESYFTEPTRDISSFFDNKRYFRYRLYMSRENPGGDDGFFVAGATVSYNHAPGAVSHAGPPFSSAKDGGISGWPLHFAWNNAADADGDSLE
ncbi:MAG: Kelch repeat-containing protein, partial [Elusimicrobiota bacterium]